MSPWWALLLSGGEGETSYRHNLVRRKMETMQGMLLTTCAQRGTVCQIFISTGLIHKSWTANVGEPTLSLLRSAKGCRISRKVELRLCPPEAPPQIPPPANNFSGLCAQSSLPNMARQDGIPGSGLPNPNLQQLPGQTPGPGYHPQQGKEGCLVSNWKQKMHWESLLELWTLKFGVLQT